MPPPKCRTLINITNLNGKRASKQQLESSWKHRIRGYRKRECRFRSIEGIMSFPTTSCWSLGSRELFRCVLSRVISHNVMISWVASFAFGTSLHHLLWSLQNFDSSFLTAFLTICRKQIFYFSSRCLRKWLPLGFQTQPSILGDVTYYHMMLFEYGWHLPYIGMIDNTIIFKLSSKIWSEWYITPSHSNSAQKHDRNDG